MNDYFKKIKAKDEVARKRILYSYMAVSMVLVFAVWVYGLGYRLHHKEVEVAKAQNETKPLVLFKNSVITTYKNITASVGSAPSVSKIVKEEEKEEIPGDQIDLIVVEEQ